MKHQKEKYGTRLSRLAPYFLNSTDTKKLFTVDPIEKDFFHGNRIVPLSECCGADEFAAEMAAGYGGSIPLA